jgi:hypothetical protein
MRSHRDLQVVKQLAQGNKGLTTVANAGHSLALGLLEQSKLE